MEETKSTPGPWAIETPCGFPYTGIFIVSHKANKDKCFHSFIAEIRQYRENGEAMANATLIAAAPETARQRDELLKTLTDLLPYINECEIAKQIHRTQAQAIREVVISAIAKATGKE